MPATWQSRSPSIHRRMCVRCGYDGRGVEDGIFRPTDPWCPNCGCDFRRRPPQSYAELEGLYDEPFLTVEPHLPSPKRSKSSRQEFYRRLERCLAAIFVLLVGVVIAGQLVYLAFSAIN